MAEVKKSANYGEWTIEILDTDQVVVKKSGEVCEKAMPELRAIAEAFNYEYDPEWNTQFFGRSMIDIINMKEAMALKIDGRMKVSQLKRNFKCIYNATLRVYDGRKTADDNATLSELRAEGCTGGDMTCKPEDTVEYFEFFLKNLYGIHVEVATIDDWVQVLDSMPLGRIKEIGKNATKKKMEEMLNN